MLILILLVGLAAVTVVLYRHLRAKRDAGVLWRSSLTIGASVGIARAVLACVGWYGVEHTGGPLQVPAFALAMLSWPEAIVFGRHQGPVPLHLYVSLGLLLAASSVLLVSGVALAVQTTHGQGRGLKVLMILASGWGEVRVRTSQVLAAVLVAVCSWQGCTTRATDPDVPQTPDGSAIPVGSAPDAAKSQAPARVGALTVSTDGWCSDLRPYASSLVGIDVPKTDFDGRLRCVAGDFDCNGSTDYAVTAYNAHLDPGGTIPGPYKVLFLDGTSVIRDVKIDTSDLYLYRKTDQVGEFGEPAASCDGLIHPGEGGSTLIFLFNRETGKFDETEYASDRESD